MRYLICDVIMSFGDSRSQKEHRKATESEMECLAIVTSKTNGIAEGKCKGRGWDLEVISTIESFKA